MSRACIWGLLMTISLARPRVLILSMRFGHAEIAAALKRSLSTFGVDVDILDSSTLTSGANLYEWFVQRNPFLCNLWAHMTKGFSNSSMAGLNALNNLIMRSNYLIVVCNFPAIQKSGCKSCGKFRVPYVVIPADIGQPKTWRWIQDRSSTLYLLGSNYLAAEARDYYNALQISGMILRPEFENIRNVTKAEMKKRLGLDPVKPIILVAFGSLGASVMTEIAQMFSRYKDKQFVFICGTYAELQQKLLRINPDYTVLGYIKNMDEYMRAADVFIGKPGPGCVSEAVQCETPVILKDGLDVLPQELPNIDFVKDNGFGIIISSYKELPKAVEEVLMGSYTFPLNHALRETTHFIVSCIKAREKYIRRVYHTERSSCVKT